MNSLPLPNANLSQILFRKNEKLIKPSNHNIFQGLGLLSNLNILQDKTNSIEDEIPAYLAQAKLSTLYQDSPWNILSASNKYGMPTMGGDIDPSLPPGHRPGNTLHTTESFENEKPKLVIYPIVWN